MENEEGSFFEGNAKMAEFLDKPDGENWGMIMESGSATYLIRNHCDHYIVGSLATRYYGFAVAKGKCEFFSVGMFLCRGFSLLQSEHPLFLHFPVIFFKIFFVKVEAF